MAGTAFASAAGWTAVTAAQRLSSPYAELWSDAVSWTVLLVVATIRPCIESKPTQKTVLTDSDSDSSSRFPLDNATLDSRDIPKDAASRTLWAVAVSLGVVSMFKTEIGIIACTVSSGGFSGSHWTRTLTVRPSLRSSRFSSLSSGSSTPGSSTRDVG